MQLGLGKDTEGGRKRQMVKKTASDRGKKKE